MRSNRCLHIKANGLRCGGNANSTGRCPVHSGRQVRHSAGGGIKYPALDADERRRAQSAAWMRSRERGRELLRASRGSM